LAKKSKKQDHNVKQETHRKSEPRPDITNMDDIALLLDEDLMARISQLDEGRNRALGSGHDPYYWEVELAYHKREQGLRRVRREIHDRWSAEQINTYNSDESNLPYADFDNLKYVMVNLHEKAGAQQLACV